MIITREGFAVLERDSHMSRWVEKNGELEQVDPLLVAMIKPGQNVLDIGAALGDHTVGYARGVGPAGKVYAFEPNPQQVECLIYNTRHLPQVQVCPVALGIKAGTAVLHENLNVGASHLEHGPGPIPVTTIDAFLGGVHVHFMKIDVEGDELDVILGGLRTILRYRPKIVIEINLDTLVRNNQTPKDILDVLTGIGYDHRPIIGTSDMRMYDLLAEYNQ